MFWNRQPRVGLDVGSEGLKVCVVESQRRCVVRASSLQGEGLLELAGLRKSRVVGLALEDPSVTAGYLEFPALSAGELKFAIPSAVARECPFPLADVRLFHEMVPALGGGDRLGAFYVAVPERVVAEKSAVCARLSLEVRHCEPAIFSQLRGLWRNRSLAAGRTVALVAVGARATSVLVSRDGHPYYFRSFRLAGAEFTRAFQQVEGCDWNTAERAKREYDVASRLKFFVEPVVLRWLRQLRWSWDDFATRFADFSIHEVLLSGGSAAWSGLGPRLQEVLGMAVGVQDWDRFQPDGRCLLGEVDVALGMALR